MTTYPPCGPGSDYGAEGSHEQRYCRASGAGRVVTAGGGWRHDRACQDLACCLGCDRAGALVLTPVFSGPFLFISAFLCGAITGIGILLQNLRAPRLVVPFVQLLVLVELISFFLRETLKFGLIPVKATALEFQPAMVNAMDSINRFSAPLPPDSHLTLFAASVIAATGLLIHVIAVQLTRPRAGCCC